jgi:ABC-type Zn2+ transport system substrate-binding protein/surface adhesin
MNKYNTRKEAQAIVDQLNGMTYYLAYGEHSRATFTVRKVRGEDAYYIHAKYHYYAGTFNARKSGALTVDCNELYNL